MKIKALSRGNYGDYKDYFRKCFIVDFLKSWSGVDVIAVCVYFNGKIDQVPIEDIKIIDEDYLPVLQITEEEKCLTDRMDRHCLSDCDYVKVYHDGGIDFIQADEARRKAQSNCKFREWWEDQNE